MFKFYQDSDYKKIIIINKAKQIKMGNYTIIINKILLIINY